MDTLIARLEAAADREQAIKAFVDVGAFLGADCPDDFVRHVEQAARSGSDTRAMGYLLLAALSLVPEDYWWSVHATTGCWAEVGPRNRFDQEGGGATPALALAIAALKARSAA